MATDIISIAKRGAKRLLKNLGVEAHGYIPGSSREAQLLAAMRTFGVVQVFDIGANTGQFALELLGSGYTGEIISVEPLTEAHSELTAAARSHPRWKIHTATAVGAAEGSVSFYVSENSVSSSALEVMKASVDAAAGSRQVTQRVVPLTTVDALVRHHGVVEHGAMLKIDTQGYEWSVLDGARSSLHQFDMVLLELSLAPLYVGQHLWLDLVERMAEAGFDVWSFQPEFIDPATGQTLQVNGLFSKGSSERNAATGAGT